MIPKNYEIQRLQKFCKQWSSMSGRDHEEIFSLEVGGENECALLTKDIEALLDMVKGYGEGTRRSV